MANQYWQDKNVVVCGASDGLGRELAQQLAVSHVGSLTLLARTESKLEQFATSLRQKNPQLNVAFYAVDLRELSQLEEVAKEISQNSGPVDLAIQAVGLSDRGSLSNLSVDRLRELIDVNVATSLHCIRAFKTHMRPGRSHLALIGSLASLFAPRYLGGYAIAKHAMAALAQQARLELRPEGIHVTLACPGPIARHDAGTRYAAQANDDLPPAALEPGGGVELKGLAIDRLATDILHATQHRRPILIRPRSAKWLAVLSAVWPTLGDSILSKKTS